MVFSKKCQYCSTIIKNRTSRYNITCQKCTAKIKIMRGKITGGRSLLPYYKRKEYIKKLEEIKKFLSNKKTQ